ncbi:MAG TPA: hypothetical protein VJQ44_11485 [Gemmatimonadales bacterium]|nr:hypothetical protein [Gemmatimonadales bacterium]
MTTPRAALIHVLALAAGLGLFVLCFGAIFTGSWPLLVAFLLCYAAVGAAAVRLGGVPPTTGALLLIVPAGLFVTWLFPASIPEAGLLRALLWPGLVALMGGLAWVGGRAAKRPRSSTFGTGGIERRHASEITEYKQGGPHDP